MIQKVFDLDVFRISYQVAMDIFHLAKDFPKEERYSLTDQITRSSRAVSANIAEGWGRRVYENEFKKFLIYAMGSLEETKVWLYFSKDCKYLTEEKYLLIEEKLNVAGAKLYKLYDNWRSF